MLWFEKVENSRNYYEKNIVKNINCWPGNYYSMSINGLFHFMNPHTNIFSGANYLFGE